MSKTTEVIRWAGDTDVSAVMAQRFLRICKDEGIPPSGLTILGGKPYINCGGLDVKLNAKCKKEELIKARVEAVPIKGFERASKDNNMTAGFKGIVELFAEKTFHERLSRLSNPDGPTVVALREALTYHYEDIGWASLDTIKMRSMQVPDHITHMASRRATNRAKRLATTSGLTSVDELNQEDGVPVTGNAPKTARIVKPKPVGEELGDVIDATFTKPDDEAKADSGKSIVELKQTLTAMVPDTKELVKLWRAFHKDLDWSDASREDFEAFYQHMQEVRR